VYLIFINVRLLLPLLKLYAFVYVKNLSVLLLKGDAAGPRYNTGGSGSNFLCLPHDPNWKNFIPGQQSTGQISGIEYELHNPGFIHHNNIFSESNNDGKPLAENPAPCAACYVGGRSTVLMIPAKAQCPDGWTTEYAGYLVSEYSSEAGARGRSSYVCWDEAPEVAFSRTHMNHALIYPVEIFCGTLPCSLYPTGRELICVVCSK